MSITNEEIKKLVHSAVSKVYSDDQSLLKDSKENARKGIEQAIAFRFGVYLDDLVKKDENLANMGVHVDTEYNKRGDETKISSKYPKGIRPDVLIHSRGNCANNILAVECAGWWKERDGICKDIGKLRELTSEEYRYQLGVLIVFDKGKPNYAYF